MTEVSFCKVQDGTQLSFSHEAEHAFNQHLPTQRCRSRYEVVLVLMLADPAASFPAEDAFHLR